jgi:hypothetical protein
MASALQKSTISWVFCNSLMHLADYRLVIWDALPDQALLAIKWHREGRRGFWHWVVFVRGSRGAYVLDSNKNLKRHERKDFWRMKPKWFIEVT